MIEKKVNKIIEKFRPYINMHGGDLALVDIAEGASTGSGLIVKIKISGACVGCGMADQTFDIMLKSMIMEECPEVVDLIIEN